MDPGPMLECRCARCFRFHYVTLQPALWKPMPGKPLGDRSLTKAERQARYRVAGATAAAERYEAVAKLLDDFLITLLKLPGEGWFDLREKLPDELVMRLHSYAKQSKRFSRR